MSVSRFLDNLKDDDDDEPRNRASNASNVRAKPAYGYKPPVTQTPRVKPVQNNSPSKEPKLEALKNNPQSNPGSRRASLASLGSVSSAYDYELAPKTKKEYYPADNYDVGLLFSHFLLFHSKGLGVEGTV